MNLGGIAQGLETGMRLSQSIQDRKDRKEQQDREYGLQLQDRADRKARQAVTDEREAADYGIRAATDENKSAVSRFASIASKYGTFEAAPPEVQEAAIRDADRADRLVNKARTRRNEVAFGAQQQELSDVVSNLQTGRVPLEKVPDDQFYLALANAGRRDPTDFMPGKDGSPSMVNKAVGDITTGLETGNNGMMVQGANVLLAPELRRGVGTESAHGGKILAKEIVGFVPHPQNPDHVTPIVRIYVDNGKAVAGPRGPHDATSWYDAPLTENRTSDPNDPVKFVDMKAAMDRVGQMGMLTQALQQPEVLAKLERGREAAGSRTKELVDRYFAEGEAAAPKKQFTTTAISLPANSGSTLLRTVDARGKETGREVIEHKEKPVRERTFEAKMDAIDDLDLPESEKEEMRKKVLSGIGPDRRRGSGGGSGRGGKISESETKGILKDAERTIASRLGIQRSPHTKNWVDESGKPAEPAKVAAFNQAVAAAAAKVRDAAAEGKKTGLSAALEAGDAAANAKPATKPASKFEVGKTYTDAQGRKATYQQDGTWKVLK